MSGQLGEVGGEGHGPLAAFKQKQHKLCTHVLLEGVCQPSPLHVDGTDMILVRGFCPCAAVCRVAQKDGAIFGIGFGGNLGRDLGPCTTLHLKAG